MRPPSRAFWNGREAPCGSADRRARYLVRSLPKECCQCCHVLHHVTVPVLPRETFKAMLSVKPAFFMRKPKSRIIVTLKKSCAPYHSAGREHTPFAITPHTHNDLRQYFLHNFYFKLQRMLHTLMNLYLNRSARDQG